MRKPIFVTITEQVATYLRDEIQRGRWKSTIPGVNELAPELGVNSKTAEAALQLLVKQGALVPQGQGKPRRIVKDFDSAPPAMRISILPYSPGERKINYLLDTRSKLQEAGHYVEVCNKDLQQLKMDPKRVARVVEKSDADAWVVVAGSREVIEWFEASKIATFALFGRARDLNLPHFAPDKVPAMREALRHLVDLGHRRIVLLTHEERRKPFPGKFERNYLEEMKRHNLSVGTFNLPDWEESQTGLQHCLKELFRHTPPTALLISEASLFFAAQQFLSQNSLSAPKDLSIMCLDFDPVFSWCQPEIAHIRWNSKYMVSRVVRWANNVARGKEDRRKTSAKAEFVEGGTIGPCPRMVRSI